MGAVGSVQVKVKKAETDLLIDQLHDIFHYLSHHKVPSSKFEKRLDDAAHKWDDIKKAQPQVKTDVEPIQQGEAERIKKEVEKFGSKVRAYKIDLRKKSFYKYATGAADAYPEIDNAANELNVLVKECDKFKELASFFEFPQVVEPIVTVGVQCGKRLYQVAGMSLHRLLFH